MISGNLGGGFGTFPISYCDLVVAGVLSMPDSLTSLQNASPFTYNDPIDLASGNFLYRHDDL